MRKCKLCGGPLRSHNSVGVCSRTAACVREAQRLRQSRVGSPVNERSERYCEAIEDFHEWCDRTERDFREEMIAALNAHTDAAR